MINNTPSRGANINDRVRSAVSAALNVSLAGVENPAPLTEAVGPRFDSVAALEVVTAIETEFDIEVDFVSDDVRQSFSTLDNIATFVANKLEDEVALGRST